VTETKASEECTRSPMVPSSRATPDDSLAFAAVFERHHDFVWRSLGWLGVAKHAIDDATQDVFIVVHRRLPDYDPATPMRSWLYGIARRIADKYRVRMARSGALRLLPDAHAPAPDEILERREAADLIEGFLASLPAEQREVFVLAELEGLRMPEIAAAIDAKLNTVYSRLRLARRAFERMSARHRARQIREADDGKR
jgi:RNA polymerase sigma-70 factor (ECF subfamily)